MGFIERQQEKSLGELLLQSGRINREQLQKALAEQQRSAEPLGKTLVRLGYVQEKDVLQVLQGLLVVTFTLGPELFALEALFVREIMRWQPVNHLPHMPPHIEGLLRWRENVMPLLNLARWLGLPAQPVQEETRLVMVECVSQVFGLITDSVQAVMQLPMDRIENTPAGLHGIQARYIYGVGKNENRVITVLHLENILEDVSKQGDFREQGAQS